MECVILQDVYLSFMLRRETQTDGFRQVLFKIDPFTRNVSKLYINGWPCIVNAEDKEYLQLKVKVLNKLACLQPWKMNEFQQISCLVKRLV